MSLRNRCNQLSANLHILYEFYSMYKMKEECEEIYDLILRLNNFPKFIEKKPELAQEEISFIIEQTEKFIFNIHPKTWAEFKSSNFKQIESQFE